MNQTIEFFPQRLKLPSSLDINNPAGYADAVEKLGAPDEILAPIWWAKQN